MWEITLCGEIDNYFYIKELQDDLKRKLNKNIISVIYIKENLICNLAISNVNDINFVKKAILECLLKIAKHSFFKENIDDINYDESLNYLLISSLIMVDIGEEVDEVFKDFDTCSYINIKSFISFKFYKFKGKWKYLCEYINYNFSQTTSNVYLDCLKFLTTLRTPEYDILYLEKNNKFLEFFDKNHKKLQLSFTTDEEALVSLILMSPQKIIINCYDKLSSKVSLLIKYIFNDKLTYLL